MHVKHILFSNTITAQNITSRLNEYSYIMYVSAEYYAMHAWLWHYGESIAHQWITSSSVILTLTVE